MQHKILLLVVSRLLSVGQSVLRHRQRAFVCEVASDKAASMHEGAAGNLGHIDKRLVTQPSPTLWEREAVVELRSLLGHSLPPPTELRAAAVECCTLRAAHAVSHEHGWILASAYGGRLTRTHVSHSSIPNPGRCWRHLNTPHTRVVLVQHKLDDVIQLVLFLYRIQVLLPRHAARPEQHDRACDVRNWARRAEQQSTAVHNDSQRRSSADSSRGQSRRA